MLLPRKINSSDHGPNISSRKCLGGVLVLLSLYHASPHNVKIEPRACQSVTPAMLPSSSPSPSPSTCIHAYESQSVCTGGDAQNMYNTDDIGLPSRRQRAFPPRRAATVANVATH